MVGKGSTARRKSRSVYRKKPKFRGNRYTVGRVYEQGQSKNPPATSGTEFSVSTPESNGETSRRGVADCLGQSNSASSINQLETPKSVSAKKILATRQQERAQPAKEKTFFAEPHGFRFFDLQIINSVLSQLSCPECCQTDLSFLEIPSKRNGCSSFFHLNCKNCSWKSVFCSSKKINRYFEVNRRLAYAMRSIGKGRKGAVRFCTLMNMPGPSLP